MIKNEGHSQFVTHYSEYKHPISTGEIFIISKYMLIILNLDLACIVNVVGGGDKIMSLDSS